VPLEDGALLSGIKGFVMKELVLVLMILASSVALNRFGFPSEMERDAAQLHRRTQEEQEQLTREILAMRNDINHQLEVMERQVNNGTKTGQDLESLKARLEKENRDLQYLTNDTKRLTRDAWDDAKVRVEKQIIQLKLEYLHVQTRMEKMMSGIDKK